MKFHSPVRVESKARWCVNGKRAFTLVEMVITAAIFSLVVLAMVYTQIFGLRQDELAQSKLGASDASRRGFDQLALDIHSAKTWSVGNMVASTYTALTNGALQTGTAIELCLSTNLNIYIRYYFVTNQGQLYRVHTNQTPTLICKNLTNSLFFQAEDYKGVVQTTLSHKCIIHVMLQFAQYQYPQTIVGAGYFYDFYKMEFRLTPHVPDGP
jgi:prepilin-type N-terminal cleavage/methylation domain-containing protein